MLTKQKQFWAELASGLGFFIFGLDQTFSEIPGIGIGIWKSQMKNPKIPIYRAFWSGYKNHEETPIEMASIYN